MTPDQSEFPLVKPVPENYQFPAQILTDEWLANALAGSRLLSLRQSLVHVIEKHGDTQHISYVVPWNDPAVLARSSVDMIYSQAALEHVDDLELTYRTFYQWLCPDGWMSHEIDFASHGIADEWNGHWAFSSRLWKLVRGNRPYLLNRQPYATHLKLLHRFGFEVVREIRAIDRTGVTRPNLAPEFKDISDDDLVTRTAFLQAVKTREPGAPRPRVTDLRPIGPGLYSS